MNIGCSKLKQVKKKKENIWKGFFYEGKEEKKEGEI